MQKLLAILVVASLRILATSAQTCGQCQDVNDVYCVNQTNYYNCMGGEIMGNLESCESGFICSNSTDVCVAESDLNDDVSDVCGSSGSGNCGSCSNGSYTCVSQNQYSRCISGAASATVYSCGSDEVCVLSALEKYKNICVPSCTLSFLKLEATCSNTGYTTTTTVAPSTTTGVYTNVCDDAATTTSNFFYTINTQDTTCQSYIYCQRSSATAAFNTAIYLTCPTATPYYNNDTKKCVSTKPTGC